MWTTSAQHTTTATPAAVWAVWRDVDGWPQYDASLEGATLDGPFAAGTTGTITPVGAGTLPFTLTHVDDGRAYSDQTVMGPVAILFRHRVEPHTDGAAIEVSVEVEGPDEDAIGPAVADDLPQALAALAARAEGRR